MKVLLVKDVSGLGRSGEVKEVSDGHARNFLIPRHLVLPATTPVLQKVQKEQKEQQEKVQRQLKLNQELLAKLSNKVFKIKGKGSKSSLFASISEKQIANAINEKLKTELTEKQIKTPYTIKSLGLHEVNVRLSDQHYAKVKIEVEKQEE